MRVFPVPVAPAIRPWRFDVASGSRTTASDSSFAVVDAAPEVERRSLERVGVCNRLCEAAHRAYDKHDGSGGTPKAGCAQAARGLPDLRARGQRQAARVPRLRGVGRRSRARSSTRCRDFYETSYANVHRGVYKLAEDATAGYEGARAKVATFLNAPSEREVIFTRSATEGINLVAYAWGLDNLGPGDVVVVTELEHHSNFVPWQYVAKRTGAEFRAIPFDDNGELVLESLDEIAAAGNVKVVANNLVSNSLGTINPSERLGGLGARAGCDHGRRRRAGRAAPDGRRAGARRGLRRDLLAQDVRPDRASARSGASASCSSRCRRSTWAAR